MEQNILSVHRDASKSPEFWTPSRRRRANVQFAQITTAWEESFRELPPVPGLAHQPLPKNLAAVLWYYDFRSRHRRLTPPRASVPEIARNTKMSPNTVRSCQAALIAHGYLIHEPAHDYRGCRALRPVIPPAICAPTNERRHDPASPATPSKLQPPYKESACNTEALSNRCTATMTAQNAAKEPPPAPPAVAQEPAEDTPSHYRPSTNEAAAAALYGHIALSYIVGILARFQLADGRSYQPDRHIAAKILAAANGAPLDVIREYLYDRESYTRRAAPEHRPKSGGWFVRCVEQRFSAAEPPQEEKQAPDPPPGSTDPPAPDSFAGEILAAALTRVKTLPAPRKPTE